MANKNKIPKEDYPEISLEKFTELYNSIVPSWDWIAQTPDIKTGRMLVTLHFVNKVENINRGNSSMGEVMFYIPSATHFTPEIKRIFHFSNEEIKTLSEIANAIISIYPTESDFSKMAVRLKEQFKPKI